MTNQWLIRTFDEDEADERRARDWAEVGPEYRKVARAQLELVAALMERCDYDVHTAAQVAGLESELAPEARGRAAQPCGRAARTVAFAGRLRARPVAHPGAGHPAAGTLRRTGQRGGSARRGESNWNLLTPCRPRERDTGHKRRT